MRSNERQTFIEDNIHRSAFTVYRLPVRRSLFGVHRSPFGVSTARKDIRKE
jgi:hypothetical protein